MLSKYASLYGDFYFSLVAGNLRPSADFCVGVLVTAVHTTLGLSRTQEAGVGVLSLWLGLLPTFRTVSCKHCGSYL